MRSRSWSRRRSREGSSNRRAFGKCRLVRSTAGMSSCSLLHHVKNMIEPKQQTYLAAPRPKVLLQHSDSVDS